MFGNENFPLPARADLPYGWKLGTTRKPGGDWGGRLSDMAEVLDIVVVGGGINGAGISRDAVGRGLSVLLFAKSDHARATPLQARTSRVVGNRGASWWTK